MTQKEAREIFDSKSYEIIMAEIKKAAEEGKFNWIWYHGKLSSSLKQKLEDDGYKINDHVHAGRHDPGIQIFF